MTWHLVTTDFPPMDGGIATWTEGIARGLVEAGEEVVVHARGRPQGTWPFAVRGMPGRSWARWGGAWAALSVRPRLREGDRDRKSVV